MAWCSLGALDALPLLLFQGGGGICSFLLAVSILALILLLLQKKKKKTFQHVPSLITLTKTLTKTNVAGESYKNEHDSCKIYYFDVSKPWSDLIKRNGSLATTMSENTQKYISI